MTDTEQRLLDSLIEMETAVKSISAAGAKIDLLPMFQRIEELQKELPPGQNPRLSHYLQRKSYQKARMLLQGDDPEKGTCA